jgi:hypothetical protein
MTGKPKIDRYEEKKEWLYKLQNGLCSGCGRTLTCLVKIDLAHYFPRTNDNLKKYPLFLDSIINISLQCNFCNVNHITQYGKEPMTDPEAQKIENYLRANPAVCEWVNNPNIRDFKIKDIMEEINNFK